MEEDEAMVSLVVDSQQSVPAAQQLPERHASTTHKDLLHRRPTSTALNLEQGIREVREDLHKISNLIPNPLLLNRTYITNNMNTNPFNTGARGTILSKHLEPEKDTNMTYNSPYINPQLTLIKPDSPETEEKILGIYDLQYQGRDWQLENTIRRKERKERDSTKLERRDIHPSVHEGQQPDYWQHLDDDMKGQNSRLLQRLQKVLGKSYLPMAALGDTWDVDPISPPRFPPPAAALAPVAKRLHPVQRVGLGRKLQHDTKELREKLVLKEVLEEKLEKYNGTIENADMEVWLDRSNITTIARMKDWNEKTLAGKRNYFLTGKRSKKISIVGSIHLERFVRRSGTENDEAKRMYLEKKRNRKGWSGMEWGKEEEEEADKSPEPNKKIEFSAFPHRRGVAEGSNRYKETSKRQGAKKL